ncbi:MAG TPA: D-alanyl-D-alanine carboxypeptidase [Acidimicrobiia bacterium]|nr:D-alanyl-D-alanine carboxypeptidase [Acidimicrobiia bacterium]
MGHGLRRAVVFVLGLAAGGCALLAIGAGADPARDATAAPLATPVWSPRRVPQPIVDGVGAQRLQSRLDAALGGVNACLVVTTGDGDTVLASRNPDAPLLPASNQKLFTAVAALQLLGPEHKFETKVVAPAAPENGVVDQLWLIGGGDPVLATPPFAAELMMEPFYEGTDVVLTPLVELADAVVAAGVRQVRDGVHGDDSRYETVRYLPSWSDTYRTGGHIGPLGALTVNDGFSVLNPEPVPVDDPALFAALEFTRLLGERGVQVGGSPDHSSAPGDAAPIGSVQSRPLRDIVGGLLRSSDNLTGELLTRELGLRASNEGTTAAGAGAILTALAELGIPTEGLTVIDGSGLDRGDQASCNQLIATLDLGERPEFQALWDGLAVAGETGTLRPRLNGTPLEGRLRAKTGALMGVTALTGLLDLGRPLRFAFLASGGFSEGEGIGLREQIAGIIAEFPNAPVADALVPAPVPRTGSDDG